MIHPRSYLRSWASFRYICTVTIAECQGFRCISFSRLRSPLLVAVHALEKRCIELCPIAMTLSPTFGEVSSCHALPPVTKSNCSLLSSMQCFFAVWIRFRDFNLFDSQRQLFWQISLEVYVDYHGATSIAQSIVTILIMLTRPEFGNEAYGRCSSN